MVKLEYGVLDSATLVSTTNPLPVDQTNTTVADGGALPAKGVQVGGTDGSVFQVLSTDNAGRLNTNINGTVPVSDGAGSLTVDASAGSFAVNDAQIAGTAYDVNSGNKSAGTQRVVLATDQPQLTNALKVDGSAVTQPVSDGGGSLTVDGTVTANAGTGTFTTQPVPVNTISTANSTTAVLAGGAAFTGTSEDVSGYSIIFVTVFTSHASATDGLSLQQSSDGTNWDITDTYTIPATSAGQGKTFSLNTAGKFFRLVYTNGATLQTSFRLQTIFKRFYGKPSSQRPADGYSNEVDLEQVSSFPNVWNGSTWDRLPGAAASGLVTNLKTVNGTAVDVNSGAKSAGTQRVILASDQTVVPVSDNAGSLTVDASAATFGVNAAQVSGTAISVNSGNKDAGTQRVTLATDQVQLTNALKVDGSAVTQPVSGTVTANIAAAAGAAGLSKFHLVSAATTNATNVKASAGKLHGWYIYNSNAAARKVAFHNTSGSPTAGTSVTDSIVVPPTSAANAFTDTGIAFSTGIAITTVTDLADSGTTAVAANDLVINLYFI